MTTFSDGGAGLVLVGVLVFGVVVGVKEGVWVGVALGRAVKVEVSRTMSGWRVLGEPVGFCSGFICHAGVTTRFPTARCLSVGGAKSGKGRLLPVLATTLLNAYSSSPQAMMLARIMIVSVRVPKRLFIFNTLVQVTITGFFTGIYYFELYSK
jgi:hypothetical protein